MIWIETKCDCIKLKFEIGNMYMYCTTAIPLDILHLYSSGPEQWRFVPVLVTRRRAVAAAAYVSPPTWQGIRKTQRTTDRHRIICCMPVCRLSHFTDRRRFSKHADQRTPKFLLFVVVVWYTLWISSTQLTSYTYSYGK